jgi:trehalose 6-phosphate phosphatase
MDREAKVLGAVVDRPGETGLVLDFDGVLSPIVPNPADSQLLEGTAEVLAELIRFIGVIAVASGRPLEFLMNRVPVAGIDLLGSYGLEELRDGSVEVAPSAVQWLPQVDDALRRLQDVFSGQPGIQVEQKSVSVAVHWRQSVDRDLAGVAVQHAIVDIARQTGLRVEGGKFVLELRPPIEVDKGTALKSLIARRALKQVVYIGDDLGDVPAMELAFEHGYAILVDHGAETDARLQRLATETLYGVEEVATWLRDLLELLQGHQLRASQ